MRKILLSILLISNVCYGATTWNPSDKNANIVLTNGNLTAGLSSSGSYVSVRGTTSHSSGKWYYEITVGSTGILSIVAGFATSSASLNSFIGSDGFGYSYGSSPNPALFPCTGSGTLSGHFTNNDVLGFAVDLGLSVYYISINGTFLSGQNPSTNTGGVSLSGCTATSPTFPASSFISSGDATGTAKFSTPFTNSAPIGFTGWDNIPSTIPFIFIPNVIP